MSAKRVGWLVYGVLVLAVAFALGYFAGSSGTSHEVQVTVAPRVSEEGTAQKLPAAETQTQTGLVNLNTADEAKLQTLPGIGPATAAGIRAFAYDEPGVYLETNVRSVFIHELFPEREQVADSELIPLVSQTCPPAGQDVRGWYYALLDYGAHLKKTLPNPSRRSKHHSRQSEFQGSNRQKRSFVLRCVLESPQTALQLQEALDAFELAAGRPRVAPAELSRILEKLEEEGLIQQKGELWLVG